MDKEKIKKLIKQKGMHDQLKDFLKKSFQNFTMISK